MEEDNTAEDGNVQRRVKLYQLNGDGQWDDRGTGNVDYWHFNKAEGNLILTVVHEDSREVLLRHRVEACVDYQRQGDTIVTWCELETGVDLALSFQDRARCSEVYEKIIESQKFLGNQYVIGDDVGDLGEASYEIVLPPAEVEHLEEIARKLNDAPLMQRHGLAESLIEQNYLEELFELAAQLESSSDLTSLQHMFRIFRGLFMLNDGAMLDILLGTQRFMLVVSCLEYDPDLPKGSDFHRHRRFFARAKLKKVVDFHDDEVLEKVHMNFRVMYVKNVILLAYLDDPTQSTLTSLLFSNNLVIIKNLAENEEFVLELFNKLQILAPLAHLKPGESSSSSSSSSSSETAAARASSSSSSSSKQSEQESLYSPVSALPVSSSLADLGTVDSEEGSNTLPLPPQNLYQSGEDSGNSMTFPEVIRSFEERKSTFLFLQELCNIARTLQINVRSDFYTIMAFEGVFDVLDEALRSSDHLEQHWMWLCCADILTSMLNHNPAPFREYALRQHAEFQYLEETDPFQEYILSQHKEMQNPHRRSKARPLREPRPSSTSSSSSTTDSSSTALKHSEASSSVSTENLEQILGTQDERKQKKPIAALLFGVLLEPKCPTGLIHQLAQILRMLLDSEPLEGNTGDEFVTLMFEKYIPLLVRALSAPSTEVTPTAKYHACELLSFCAVHHFVLLKKLIEQENAMENLRDLVAQNKTNSHLVCAVIRFLRRITAVGDHKMGSMIANSKVLTPIVECFAANGERYNLLNSVVLAFFDNILKENVVPCVSYLVENHETELKAIEYIDIFEDLSSLQDNNNMRDEQAKWESETPDELDLSKRSNSDVRGDFGDQNSHTYFETGWEYGEELEIVEIDGRPYRRNPDTGEIWAVEPEEELNHQEDSNEEDDALVASISFKRKAQDDDDDFEARVGGQRRKRQALKSNMSPFQASRNAQASATTDNAEQEKVATTPVSALGKLGQDLQKESKQQDDDMFQL